jgi:hypothetical protein
MGFPRRGLHGIVLQATALAGRSSGSVRRG